MSTEMAFLLWSIALAFAQMLVAVTGSTLQVGLPALAGNREGLPEPTGWVFRAHRAHRNMLENMVLFIPLVLMVGAAGKAGELTHWGVQLFFWGRVAYAAVFLVGIPWLRTGVWFVSAIGMLLLFIALV